MSLVDPQSNVESYLANLNGESTPLPLPPESNVEKYLAKMAGVQDVELPHKPESRVEVYLEQLALNPPSPGEVTVRPLTVTQNGTYSEDGIAYRPVNVNVQPTLVKKTISENGTYKASEDSADGYSEVEVEVPDPVLDDITITENGVYTSEHDGFDEVTVEVPDPVLDDITITENGVYTSEHDGFDEVTVDVQPPENSYQLKSITTPTSLATFEASAMPMPSLKVSVEAQQDLHGYDKPWVGGAGKNKIDSSHGVLHQYTSDATVLRWGYEPITLKAGTYTVSYVKNGNYVLYLVYTDTWESVDLSPNGTSFTISEQREIFIRSALSSGNTEATFLAQFSNVQLEEGNQATTFAPYSNICPISGFDEANVVVSPTENAEDGTTYNVNWQTEAGTVYGGNVDLVSGVLTVTHQIDTISGGITRTDSSGYLFVVKDLDVPDITDYETVTPYIISNYLTPYSVNELRANAVFGFTQYNKRLYIRLGADITTVADANAYLASNNLQVKYELATPTTLTTQPTPIKSLNGINNLSVDCGDVIEGEYFKAL